MMPRILNSGCESPSDSVSFNLDSTTVSSPCTAGGALLWFSRQIHLFPRQIHLSHALLRPPNRRRPLPIHRIHAAFLPNLGILVLSNVLVRHRWAFRSKIDFYS